MFAYDPAETRSNASFLVSSDLEPVVKERFTGRNFQDIDGVYNALDCGESERHDYKYSWLPMLKIYGKQLYIRADSKFHVTFRH